MSVAGSIRSWERWLWPLLTLLCCLGVWHVAVRISGTTVFPSPAQVLRGTVELAHKHVLWDDILDSLRRVVLGFVCAVGLGLPLGVALGWSEVTYEIVNPILQLIRPISPIAWVPLAIVFFGVGEGNAVFLIFLGAFFPIVLATTDGVRSIPRLFWQTGQNFGLSAMQMFRYVLLPAAMPRILGGLRVAAGIAWLVVVAAEMVALDSGLGFLVIDSRNSGKRYDLVIAAMLLIGVLGFLLDFCFRALESVPSLRWGFRHDQ